MVVKPGNDSNFWEEKYEQLLDQNRQLEKENIDLQKVCQ